MFKYHIFLARNSPSWSPSCHFEPCFIVTMLEYAIGTRTPPIIGHSYEEKWTTQIMLTLLDLTAEKWEFEHQFPLQFNESRKQSIVSYESFSDVVSVTSFKHLVARLLHNRKAAAARLIFVVVATSGAEGCRRMLSGSLHQWLDSKICSFSLWTPQVTD